jgi:hypothetical protein
MVSTYTASNANKCYFDDVYYGAPVVDSTPPEVLSLEVLDPSTLQIAFSEDVLGANAVGSYFVSGIGNPLSASGSGNTYTLNFASAFPANTTFNLQLSGITDLSGNPLPEQEIPFMYFQSVPVNLGDVVINELLADPSPVIGLPDAEFLELFNTTNEAIALNNWVLVNTTTEKTLPDYALQAGGFVILCDENNVAAFQSYGDVLGIPSFTALSNTGDSLTLLSADSDIIDIVAYTDDWYGSSLLAQGGVTLERINPFATCSGFENWTASTSFQGGTPGAVNSTFNDTPDVIAPVAQTLEYPDFQSVYIDFNESLDADVSQLAIEISPDLGVSDIILENANTRLLIQFNTAFTIGEPYQLQVNGVRDCSGNTISSALEFTLLRGAIPVFGDLIINEIMADPDAEVPSPNSEYVELFNKSDELIELKGIGLNNGVLTETRLIPPGGYYILTAESSLPDFIFFENVAGIIGFPGLTNSGTTLTLYDPSGELLDQVTYSIEWYGDAAKEDGGYSLELINPNDPCSDASNWTASTSATGATAGLENSVYDVSLDEIGPELMVVLVTGADQIDCFFNEPLDADLALMGNYQVTLDEDNQTVELPYSVIDQVLVSGNQLRIRFDGAFSIGPIYTLSVSNLTDCWGNDSGILSGRFAVPEAAQAQDVVINEVLFNPYTGGSDFVEIYNRSGKNISLQGWQLGDESDLIPGNFDVITDLPYVLYPNEYALLTTSIAGVADFYPASIRDRFIRMDALPSYGNSNGIVVLADSLSNIIDRFAYSEEMHYPLLDDPDGVSLERLDPNRPTQDATNWHSASRIIGFATPGTTNSQFNLAEAVAQFSAEPEVFSPDNDGYQDVCLISYELDSEGYTGSITVYDQFGLEVNRLVKNQLLGVSGTIAWNGFDAQQRKAPIGVYLLVFEAFTPDGTQLLKKTVTTLGASLN